MEQRHLHEAVGLGGFLGKSLSRRNACGQAKQPCGRAYNTNLRLRLSFRAQALRALTHVCRPRGHSVPLALRGEIFGGAVAMGGAADVVPFFLLFFVNACTERVANWCAAGAANVGASTSRATFASEGSHVPADSVGSRVSDEAFKASWAAWQSGDSERCSSSPRAGRALLFFGAEGETGLGSLTSKLAEDANRDKSFGLLFFVEAGDVCTDRPATDRLKSVFAHPA